MSSPSMTRQQGCSTRSSHQMGAKVMVPRRLFCQNAPMMRGTEATLLSTAPLTAPGVEAITTTLTADDSSTTTSGVPGVIGMAIVRLPVLGFLGMARAILTTVLTGNAPCVGIMGRDNAIGGTNATLHTLKAAAIDHQPAATTAERTLKSFHGKYNHYMQQ